ncbi:MAG: hypothetical protein US18_C0023G0012, partial [Parcubacteria group bacterium GW2011_GWB1_36_5]
MYLRDLKDVKIGGVSFSGMPKISPDNSNCIIKSIEEYSKGNLKVHLIKTDDGTECNIHIKSETEEGRGILEKILYSKKI